MSRKQLSPLAKKIAVLEKRRTSAPAEPMTAETIRKTLKGQATYVALRWTDADALGRPGWMAEFSALAGEPVLLTSHAFQSHEAAQAAATQAGATQIETFRQDGALVR